MVPEVIEEFFLGSAALTGLTPKPAAPFKAGAETRARVYKLGRVPRNLWLTGERLEPRFGKLGREYGQIAFDKELLKQDATLEWVTPGHPLFEVVREDVLSKVRDHLKRGAVFFDLHSRAPYRLDVFSASIRDGRGNVITKRLFVVQSGMDGQIAIKQPTIFLDLSVPDSSPAGPEDGELPDRRQLEIALLEQALTPLLDEDRREREREVSIISQHIELSLNTIINRENLLLAELISLKESGSNEHFI